LKDEKGIIFSDRGLGDTIAYYRTYGLEVPEEILDYARKIKYSGIFVMEILPSYEKDGFRNETAEQQKAIHEQIIKTYEELGYEI